MSYSKADAILHPIRMRIVMEIMGRQMTTQQIAAALPDVPQASLYRHIGLLTQAGVLAVVSERPVRGAVEKVYAIPERAAELDYAEFVQASREDHLRYFTVFLGSLLAQFRAYLKQDEIDILRDGLSYRTAPLNLSDAEFTQLLDNLRAVLRPAVALPPAPERRRRILSTILIPGHDDR